jgi:hypothetical protein
LHEDFMKAARKIKENKKLESKLDYSQVWHFSCLVNYTILQFFLFT